MYHLRKIDKEGIEFNYALGEQYTVINREEHKDAFIKVVEAYFKKGVDDEVFAFLQNGFGNIYSLVKDGQAYVVTNTGSTYSNLTYKGKKK